jgi:hypothetical protein
MGDVAVQLLLRSRRSVRQGNPRFGIPLEKTVILAQIYTDVDLDATLEIVVALPHGWNDPRVVERADVKTMDVSILPS